MMRRRWPRLLRAVLAVLLGHVLVLVSLSVFLSDKKFSYFYRVDYSAVTRAEDASHKAALDYIEQLESQLSRAGAGHVLWDERGPKELCIGVVTKKRDQAEYLVRSAGYLLSRLGHPQLEGDRVRVFVMSTDTPIAADRQSTQILSRVINVVYLEQWLATVVSSNDTRSTMQLKGGTACLRDEIVGYTFALEYTQRRGSECRYVMIIQDDAIVSRRFLDKLRHAIASLEAEVKAKKRGDYWIGLKLFYSDTFSGWSRDTTDYVLLSVTAVSGAVVAMIVVWAVLQTTTWRRLSLPVLLLVFVDVTAIIVLILLAAGKQNVFPPFRQPGHPVMARNSSVLVGQLYPRRQIRPLIRFLRDYVTQFDALPLPADDVEPVDVLMNRYMQLNDLDVHLLVPNLVQHIGRFSSCSWKNQGFVEFLSQSNNFPKEDEPF